MNLYVMSVIVTERKRSLVHNDFMEHKGVRSGSRDDIAEADGALGLGGQETPRKSGGQCERSSCAIG